MAGRGGLSTVATPPDHDGYCSLSLHAGATVAELHRAGADPNRLLLVEVNPNFRTPSAFPPEHRHALHVDEIDVMVAERWRPSLTLTSGAISPPPRTGPPADRLPAGDRVLRKPADGGWSFSPPKRTYTVVAAPPSVAGEAE